MTRSTSRKTLIIIFLICGFSFSMFAQNEKIDKLGGLFKKTTTIIKNEGSGSNISSDEIVSGLKEALTLGAEKSTDKLSLTDGFFKNTAVKILLPQELQSIEKKMRFLGMGKLFDNAVLSLNRAAEDASKQAGSIFISAIKSMTVIDALQILKGSDTAATSYLRKTTQVELTNTFRPIIEQSLTKIDATKYWNDVFTAYNQFSSKKMDTDINSYVTTKALDGIFYYVAQEEMSIRKNPDDRVSDILKKVFQ